MSVTAFRQATHGSQQESAYVLSGGGGRTAHAAAEALVAELRARLGDTTHIHVEGLHSGGQPSVEASTQYDGMPGSQAPGTPGHGGSGDSPARGCSTWNVRQEDLPQVGLVVCIV